MNRLEGKVAVVTGAGQGIGAAIARRYSQEGARVVIAEINEDQGRMTAERIKDETGVPVHFIKTDVADPDSIESMHADTRKTFGTARQSR